MAPCDCGWAVRTAVRAAGGAGPGGQARQLRLLSGCFCAMQGEPREGPCSLVGTQALF